MADLSEVTDLLMSHFNKNLNDEVDRLRRVAINLRKKRSRKGQQKDSCGYFSPINKTRLCPPP